jgi:hypothetical protein
MDLGLASLRKKVASVGIAPRAHDSEAYPEVGESTQALLPLQTEIR